MTMFPRLASHSPVPFTRPARRWRSAVALCIGFGLPSVGCHATKIIEIAGEDNGGIPFFPLVPANQEVRTYAQTWLKVDVQVREAVPVLKDGGKTDWKDDAMTTSFFAYVDPGHSADDAAKGVRTTIDHQTQALPLRPTLDDLQPVLAKLVKDNHLVEPPPWTSPKQISDNGIVVADQRTLTQVPATGRQFINIWAPYGGSASADIKLDSRGVLSEASAQRQDQLPPAAAGALGAVIGAALTGAGTVLGAVALLETKEHPDLEPPRPPTPGTPANEHTILVTGISVTITPVRKLYTVAATWPLSAGFEKNVTAFMDSKDGTCFALTSFQDHAGACLVNVSTAMDVTPAPPAPAPTPSNK